MVVPKKENVQFNNYVCANSLPSTYIVAHNPLALAELTSADLLCTHTVSP